MVRPALMLALTALMACSAPALCSAHEGAKKRTTVRRGGYSYTNEQSINTYGDARGKSGAANSLRDPGIDRQTNSGPFDHGFFYESGIGGQHGGNAPFMH